MKVCPTCDQTFNDEALNFCLLDGTQLVSTESQATIVVPRRATANKKSKWWLWLGLGFLTVLLGIGCLGAFLVYYFGFRGEVARNGRSGAVNASPSPKPPVAPSVTPSPKASSWPSPETTPTPDEADEITPIAWNTSGATFKTEDGKTYTFLCPPGGTAGAVWGSDIYTADSSICTAAVHAGIITLDRGGNVTIEFRPGRSIYGSTTRNGITSNTFGEYSHSFIVR
jgi:hypothetical protein